MLRTNSLNVIDVCQILNELQFDRMNIWIYNCRSYRLNSHNRYDSCHTTIYLFTFLFMTNHLHKYIMCWCSLVWIIVVVIVVIVTCLRSIAYFFFFVFSFTREEYYQTAFPILTVSVILLDKFYNAYHYAISRIYSL